jgi:methionyl-tRNA formyltransferase
VRLVFLGTPAAAVPTLDALVAAGHDVVLVITRPDKKRGRGSTVTPSPVKEAAQRLGLPVSHDLNDVTTVGAQLGVVVAYGRIIPTTILEQLPMVNVHFSLLPRWRGAAPVERAILAGDEETGVDIMAVEEGLDTGDIYGEWRTPVAQKTSVALTQELAEAGAQLLVRTLTGGTLPTPSPQVGEPTYAAKLTAEDFLLLPDASSALLARQVRLGRAFTFIGTKRLKVLEASALEASDVRTGRIGAHGDQILLGASTGSLALGRVQPEGGRSMDARDWWAGARLESGLATWGTVER